jgi:prolyl 4-hydroxylase
MSRVVKKRMPSNTGTSPTLYNLLLLALFIICILAFLRPQNHLYISVGNIQMEILYSDPMLRLARNLISVADADALIDTYDEGLERSTVYNSDGSNTVHEARTSFTRFLPQGKGPSDVVWRTEQAASSILGVPIHFLEQLQLVRYHPGQEYKPHLDYFEGDTMNRTFTIFVYLNDMHPDESGGHTIFPQLGLKISPQKGAGLIWTNCLLHTDQMFCDPKLEHGGAPTFKSVKYGLNIWARNAPWRTI